jgi:hypothetical protein
MPLDLPQPDPTQLARSPLELVVCQIRFENPSVPRDAGVALEFHGALGGSTGPYPVIEQVNTLSVSIAPVAIPAQQMAGWRFSEPDGSWVVSMMPDHVALETRRYTTWEIDFRTRLALVVDRIGELELAKPTDWEPFISPELLGLVLHPKIGSCVEASVQQLTLSLGDGVECGLRHGFLRDESATDKLDYLLDFDLYRQGARPFDPDGLKDVADQLNTYAVQLFQASATPHLLGRLRMP